MNNIKNLGKFRNVLNPHFGCGKMLQKNIWMPWLKEINCAKSTKMMKMFK